MSADQMFCVWGCDESNKVNKKQCPVCHGTGKHNPLPVDRARLSFALRTNPPSLLGQGFADPKMTDARAVFNEVSALLEAAPSDTPAAWIIYALQWWADRMFTEAYGLDYLPQETRVEGPWEPGFDPDLSPEPASRAEAPGIDRRLVTYGAGLGIDACQRCRRMLMGQGHTVSFFSRETICLACSNIEREHPEYDEARRLEQEAVSQGDFNFPGVGSPQDLYRPRGRDYDTWANALIKGWARKATR